MTVRSIPWRLLGIVVMAALALAALNHGLSFFPFSPQWSAKRAEARAERLEMDVSALQREKAGQTEIAQATDRFHTREVVIRESAAAAIAEARNAPDATVPLAPERGAILRGADDGVCQSAPTLCPAADAP